MLRSTFSVLFLLLCRLSADLPVLEDFLESASVKTRGDELVVSTGLVERTWRWTGRGLATTSLKDSRSGLDWVNQDSSQSDWQHDELLGDSEGELISLTAKKADDEGFTSPHLRVQADIRYPSRATVVRYEVWAFPGSEGFRTQLWVKKDGPVESRELKAVEAPRFSVSAGTFFTAKEALETAQVRYAGSIQHKEKIELKLEGIDPGRAYQLGLSWWDFGGGGRTQSLEATSIDGEVRATLMKPTLLPGWKSKREKASSFIVALPKEVNMDGSAKILVNKLKGPNAVMNEVWLYGPGPAIDLKISAERRKELEQLAPAGMSLVSYFKAGTKTGQKVRSGEHRSDFLPIAAESYRAIGYYNDTQNRHEPETHLIREEVVPQGKVDWASILCLESSAGGVVLVKESHKCVNQKGVDTGSFLFEQDGVSVTGWGLGAADLESEFRWCWANWTILYPDASDEARELALKRFDRTRYPVSVERDLYMKANTWGSGINQPASFARAKEDEVLAEIDSVTDLGLDALQIDDGWQVGRMKKKPAELTEWQVRPDWYPEGWTNVVERAAEREIDLGVWFAARAPEEDLKASFDQAGFTTYKLESL